jgi:hypothetical protein
MGMDKTSEKKAAKAIRDKRYRLRKKLDAGTITGAESDWLYRVETGNPAPGEEVEAPEVMAEADILPPPAPALVRGEAIARAVDEALTEAGAVTTPEAEAIVRRAVEPLGVTVEAETEPWGSGLNWSARLGPGTSEDVIHSAEHGPDCSGESGPIADPIDLGLVNCLECLQFRERAVWLTLSVDERRKLLAIYVDTVPALHPRKLGIRQKLPVHVLSLLDPYERRAHWQALREVIEPEQHNMRKRQPGRRIKRPVILNHSPLPIFPVAALAYD